MPERWNLTALPVDGYADALAFYVGSLGAEPREDSVFAELQRWVEMAPPEAVAPNPSEPPRG